MCPLPAVGVAAIKCLTTCTSGVVVVRLKVAGEIGTGQHMGRIISVPGCAGPISARQVARFPKYLFIIILHVVATGPGFTGCDECLSTEVDWGVVIAGSLGGVQLGAHRECLNPRATMPGEGAVEVAF